MIKGIIFDIGGVVVEWSNDIIYKYVSERFGLDFGEVKEKLSELLHHLQEGKISEKEFWKKFFDSYGKALPDDWKDLWGGELYRKNIKLNKDVVEIIRELKRNGYQVVALTNTERSHYVWMKKIGWYDYFDFVVASCKVSTSKPERKIYGIVLKKLGVKAAECIFIDNKEEYVRGAEATGICVVLFHNAEQLKEELRKHGVKC